ncbi:PREDICTED: zinc finger matrin-type protein 1-like [Gekko japonicus]|uniref:Zinc finger matrin-type protein 1-like n=1 Tax=Gekko japonicus TaxID=146911 RepID=A0ABM1JUP0_GEKJA|nr:PREDICTED: zinc finger matrin-type protein 1-like [Gekko japonicus]
MMCGSIPMPDQKKLGLAADRIKYLSWVNYYNMTFADPAIFPADWDNTIADNVPNWSPVEVEELLDLISELKTDDALDEATRKELCTDTFCKVCGAVLQFESQRVSHYEGKRHAQKVRLYLQMHSEQEEGQEPGKQKRLFVNFQTDPNVDKNTYCRLCNMIFTSPVVAQSHYLGKIHAKKLKQLSTDQAQHSAPSTQPQPGLSLISAVPELCHEKTSQDADAEDPSISSSASFNLDNPEKYCKLCLVSFNNPLMAHQHYVGKKHKRNEARKKLMAEIGPEALSAESKTSAIGAGNYICPICSISLTSIEMYQSHMKGNKHQIKEAMIVSLMKKAKKTYNSFQDELADYIEVQKARGLEPKTNFRKPEEEFQREEFEALSGQETIAFDQDQFSHDMYEPDQHSIFFTETCAPSYTVEKRVPSWSPALANPLKLENAPLSQLSIEPCSEKQGSPLATCKWDDNDWSSDESLTFSVRSPNYSRGSQKTKKNKKEYAGDGEENPCQQFPKPKRKRYCKEEMYLTKGSEKQKQRQVTVDSVAEWKAKHGKDKGNKDSFSEKESRKHKEKKKAKVSGPIDEETLWNESVLGF